MEKRALGRGLAALIPEKQTAGNIQMLELNIQQGVLSIPVEKIKSISLPESHSSVSYLRSSRVSLSTRPLALEATYSRPVGGNNPMTLVAVFSI